MHRTILVSTVLIFFIPLLINTPAFPATFFKGMVFQVLVQIAFAAWVVLASADRTFRPNLKHPVTITFGLTVLAFLVSVPFSVDPFSSFWSVMDRMMGAASYLHYFAWYLVLVSTFRGWKAWKPLIQTTCGVALLVTVIGFVGWLANPTEARLSSTISNTIFLGGYLLLHVFLGLALWTKAEEKIERILTGVGVGVFTTAIILTGSRGPVLALAAALFFWICWRFTRIQNRKWRYVSVGSLIGLLAISVPVVLWLRSVPYVELTERYQVPFAIARITSYGFSGDRVALWSIALDAAKERPWFGWGFESYEVAFGKYAEPTGKHSALLDTWNSRAHNNYLDVLVAAGGVGLAAYLLFWITALLVTARAAWTSMDPIERQLFVALLILLIAHGVDQLFVFETPTTLLAFVFALAVTQSLASSVRPVDSDSGEPRWYAALVLVPFAFVQWQSNVLPALQLSMFREGTMLVAEDPEKSRELIAESLSTDSLVTLQKSLQGFEFARTFVSSLGVRTQAIEAYMRMITPILEAQADKHPTSYRARYSCAIANRFLFYFGDTDALDRAQMHAERAIQLAPNILNARDELAEIAFARGDAPKAVELELEALTYAPPLYVARTHFRLADFYAGSGNYKQAFEELALAKELGYDVDGDVQVVATLAKTLMDGEYLDDAVAYADQVAAKVPGSPMATESQLTLRRRLSSSEESN